MNKKTILEKLVYIKELLLILDNRIKKYPNENNELEKKTLFAAMSKFSEEIVEIGININNILLEDKKDFASSYFETFSKLSKHYILNDNFLDKIARTTGFRNRVAHEYEKLDQEITIRSFKNLIPLYERYIVEIKKIIK